MTKTIFLIFLGFAYAGSAQVQTMVNPLERAARTVYEGHMNGEENPELFRSLAGDIEVIVTQELIAEAKAHNLDVIPYLGKPESLERFLQLTKERTSDFDNKSNAKVLVDLIKIGIRLQFHENVRFPPNNHFERTNEIRKLVPLLERKLQIYFLNPNEEHLNAVVSNLQVNENLLAEMRNAARSSLCSKGNSVNPFSLEVARALAKGGTYKVGKRTIKVPSDHNWGTLTVDTSDGGESQVQDKVAYRNEDGSLAIYRVIDDPCNKNVKVHSNIFEKINPSESEKYHFRRAQQSAPTVRNGHRPGVGNQ